MRVGALNVVAPVKERFKPVESSKNTTASGKLSNAAMGTKFPCLNADRAQITPSPAQSYQDIYVNNIWLAFVGHQICGLAKD